MYFPPVQPAPIETVSRKAHAPQDLINDVVLYVQPENSVVGQTKLWGICLSGNSLLGWKITWKLFSCIFPAVYSQASLGFRKCRGEVFGGSYRTFVSLEFKMGALPRCKVPDAKSFIVQLDIGWSEWSMNLTFCLEYEAFPMVSIHSTTILHS